MDVHVRRLRMKLPAARDRVPSRRQDRRRLQVRRRPPRPCEGRRDDPVPLRARLFRRDGARVARGDGGPALAPARRAHLVERPQCRSRSKRHAREVASCSTERWEAGRRCPAGLRGRRQRVQLPHHAHRARRARSSRIHIRTRAGWRTITKIRKCFRSGGLRDIRHSHARRGPAVSSRCPRPGSPWRSCASPSVSFRHKRSTRRCCACRRWRSSALLFVLRARVLDHGHFVLRAKALSVAGAHRLGRRLARGKFELPADEPRTSGRGAQPHVWRSWRRLLALQRERDEPRELVLAHMTDGVAAARRVAPPAARERALPAEFTGTPAKPEPGCVHGIRRGCRLEEMLRARRTPAGRSRANFVGPARHAVHAVVTPLDPVQWRDARRVERPHRARPREPHPAGLRRERSSIAAHAAHLPSGLRRDAARRRDLRTKRGAKVSRRGSATKAERLQAGSWTTCSSPAELERPEAALRRERFDLRELIARQVGLFAAAAERGLKPRAGRGRAVEANADRARLEQVIANLLRQRDQALPSAARSRARGLRRVARVVRSRGHRSRHPARGPAARVRALLPRGQGALRDKGGTGPRALIVNTSSRCTAARCRSAASPARAARSGSRSRGPDGARRPPRYRRLAGFTWRSCGVNTPPAQCAADTGHRSFPATLLSCRGVP